MLGERGVRAIPHCQTLSGMKTHPLFLFSLHVISTEGLETQGAGWPSSTPACTLLLCFPFLFFLKLQTRTRFPVGLERTWLPGRVLSGGMFGVKWLCAGLGLRDAAPPRAIPFPPIGNRPAVLCKDSIFLVGWSQNGT